MNRRSTVIGVFNYPSDAQDAICELRQLGFYDFGLMSPLNGGEAQTGLWSLRITFGEIAAVGPIVVAGPLADALIGGVGGIVGALIGLGIGEEDAVFYDEELKKGRTLVTLRAVHREEEAWMVMEYHCAYRHDQMLVTARSEQLLGEWDAGPAEMPAFSSSTCSDSIETAVLRHRRGDADYSYSI